MSLWLWSATAATTTFSLDRIVSNRFALNGRLATGPFTHDLLLANTGFNWVRYTPYQINAITLGKANLANPVIFPEPVFPDFQSRYKALVTRQQSVMLGDTVGWGDQWSLGVIESESWINVRNLNKTGATTDFQKVDYGVSWGIFVTLLCGVALAYAGQRLRQPYAFRRWSMAASILPYPTTALTTYQSFWARARALSGQPPTLEWGYSPGR